MRSFDTRMYALVTIYIYMCFHFDIRMFYAVFSMNMFDLLLLRFQNI